jgi:hypothetical protein
VLLDCGFVVPMSETGVQPVIATSAGSYVTDVERGYTPFNMPAARSKSLLSWRLKGVNTAHVAGCRLSIILALLPLFAITAEGQSTPNPNVGAQFDSIKSSFELEVKGLNATTRGGEQGYDPAQVNATLRKTKDAALTPIPVNDKPLRNYVERSFPAPVDESKDVVQKEEVETRVGVIRELLAKLSRLDSFRLNLTVNTTPAKARFELVPKVGTPVLSTTNSRLTNIYRGEYDYYITKAGYKRVHATINFIDRSGSVLECELQPDSGAEEALPCTFK